MEAVDGATLETIDPTSEEVIAEFPDAGRQDVDRAVAAAGEAAPGWAATPWDTRARVIRELAARLEERAEELALIDVADSGNPLTGMRGDIRGAARELHYFAGLGGEAKGFTLPPDPEALTYTIREPYGVVGRIIPYNHPLKFAAAKTAAPLMAGNAVVLKPAEHTSLSALELARLSEDLLPPGVFNVVTGRGGRAGEALVAHPGVPRIAFTGGVPTGRRVLEVAAEHIKHVTLELGGKNPMIVFPDADPRVAARAAVDAMNFRRTQGQSCGSNSRVFVHTKIRHVFEEALGEMVAALRVGDPRHEDTDMGPLCHAEHYRRVTGYVESGKAEGATVLVGGGRPPGLNRGYFLQPTVFTDVGDEFRIAREEIFGPVLSVIAWKDYQAMVESVNDVPYGLTANIWTNDVSVAHRTARLVHAGYVWINGSGGKPTGAPFGGFKQSGLGKEGSLEEVLSYTREKTVIVTLGGGADPGGAGGPD